MEEFADIDRILDQLGVLLTDPTSNLSAALLLYGIIGVALLVLLLVVVMILLSTSEEDELFEQAERPSVSGGAVEAAAVAPAVVRRVTTPRQRLRSLAIIVGVMAAVWIATGYSTSTTAVCASCHEETAHTQAEAGSDPHADSGCVSCHEPGGTVGRVTLNLAPRLAHFTEGFAEVALQDRYGRVSRSACESCHRRDIADATLNDERGLRMSHAEPLDASADCLDCHTMQAGVVSGHNAGMNPCLRCHDSQRASADCETCHDGNASAAARPRTTEFASVQIPEVSCGACHNEQRDCDSCHGTRLPHTKEFMAYAHARAGAVDFWYNGGRTCGQCHTETRRSCTKCHGPMLGRGHGGSGLAQSHQQATAQKCNTCHQQWAFTVSRDFCTDVCHTEAAIKYSPR